MSEVQNTLRLLWENNKFLIGGFLVLILAVPIASLAISWRSKASVANTNTQNYDRTVTLESSVSGKPATKTTTPTLSKAAGRSAAAKILEDSELGSDTGGAVGPTPSPQVYFGPTLDFSISIEGRPKDNNSAKVFVGIAEGTQVSNKPAYIAQQSVDVPKSGIYSGLPLNGLTQGSSYLAYIKGPAQIATSSAFVMTPTTVKLNNGTPLHLVTGDLNEDNTINSADYSIAQAALGATPGSDRWNANIDFNLDQVINIFDLAIIQKNLGKTGLTGTWYSPTNPPASGSASLRNNFSIGALEQPPLAPPSQAPIQSGQAGYWIWVPD